MPELPSPGSFPWIALLDLDRLAACLGHRVCSPWSPGFPCHRVCLGHRVLFALISLGHRVCSLGHRVCSLGHRACRLASSTWADRTQDRYSRSLLDRVIADFFRASSTVLGIVFVWSGARARIIFRAWVVLRFGFGTGWILAACCGFGLPMDPGCRRRQRPACLWDRRLLGLIADQIREKILFRVCVHHLDRLGSLLSHHRSVDWAYRNLGYRRDPISRAMGSGFHHPWATDPILFPLNWDWARCWDLACYCRSADGFDL